MDFKELATQRNKEKIAVIVVGYNRKNGIERLLDSINTACYDDNNIPLVISIDASGNQLLYDYVKSFNWKHGEKYVNIQENRLGLKAHIFQCASLSKYFKGVIILEDDLFVSPYYYHYCTECLEQYGSNEKVAGILDLKLAIDSLADLRSRRDNADGERRQETNDPAAPNRSRACGDY